MTSHSHQHSTDAHVITEAAWLLNTLAQQWLPSEVTISNNRLTLTLSNDTEHSILLTDTRELKEVNDPGVLSRVIQIVDTKSTEITVSVSPSFFDHLRRAVQQAEPPVSQVAPGWFPHPETGGVTWWDGQAWQPEMQLAPLAAEIDPADAALNNINEARASYVDTEGRLIPKSRKALTDEVTRLRDALESLGLAEQVLLREQLESLAQEIETNQTVLASTLRDVQEAQGQLVKVREDQILQEVGIYDYHHILEDSIAYKAQLASLKEKIRGMGKRDGGAIRANTDYTLNGSKQQGAKMIRDLSKLMLRAYNGEADRLVQTMRPYKLEASVSRLNKARDTISKLGATTGIAIENAYHRLRTEELQLSADYMQKREEEKEAEREERQRLKEEAAAKREYEREKERLRKEQLHYQRALAQMKANGDAEAVRGAELKLAEISDAIEGVEEREANYRAGYVYVISNVGSFGENVVKVGMTRRLEPMDRVRELGDASVPFRFDVHALVFSEDAVSLEQELHRRLDSMRVNLVNLRREYFYATPAEVEVHLQDLQGTLLEFVEHPEAEEWHISQNTRRRSVNDS